LFQEGIGVVVEGTWDGTNFHSDTMLVKHDETYTSDEGEYDPNHPTDGGSDEA
jgi:cytochrome c-type biogenesis protein CcmE